MLPDGSYDAICVDADDTDDGAVALSIVVLDGLHKGEVVDVRATGLRGDALDLLGTPCTLTVRRGAPVVVFD